MSLVPRQRNREELLDLGRGTSSQVRQSLHDIRRINTYLGGASVVLNATLRLLQKHRLQRATILDIGTGSADIPQRLIGRAAQQNIAVSIIALDNNFRHLTVARQDMNNAPGVLLLQADGFHLPLPDNSVDVVITSLFLHHFRPPQIVQLLREFHRVARIGWVINDLVRHYVPLIFFRLTWPIFARSYITRHDGTASILRSYTVKEMRDIAVATGIPGISVRSHLLFRMSVVCEKNRAK